MNSFSGIFSIEALIGLLMVLFGQQYEFEGTKFPKLPAWPCSKIDSPSFTLFRGGVNFSWGQAGTGERKLKEIKMRKG